MKAKEKAINYCKKNKLVVPFFSKKVNKVIDEALDIAIQEAKKEVIGIVLSYFYNRAFSRDEIEIKIEDMKRHLSTFANEQKQHNNDFMASAIKEIHTDSLDGLENETQKYLDKEPSPKPCRNCYGNGIVPTDLIHTGKCPECNGTGRAS